MTSLQLALKLLRREWRSGELRILMIALLIAISCMTSINLFGERIQQSLNSQASALLGGDAALTSSQSIPDKWLAKAKTEQLHISQTQSFLSMLAVNQTFHLANIKGVELNYPLQGYLKIENGTITRKTPSPNTIWLEPALLALLHAKVGDSLKLGVADFKITHSLTYQPSSPGGFFSLSPSAVISFSDIAKTQLIQPGSRVEYTALFSGGQTALNEFEQWVKPQLEPGQKWVNASRDRSSLQNNLDQVRHYLGLGSLMSVVLSGVALAVALKRFTGRQFDQVALLRCYGASRSQILSIYLYLLLLAGLFSLILGSILGYAMQGALDHVLKAFLKIDLPRAGLSGIWFGMVAGFWVLLAFGLPPLWQLTRVSPLQVIRRELTPLPISSFWLYLSGFLAIAALVFWYIQDTRLTLIILGGCLTAFVLFLLSAWTLISLTKIIRKKGVGVAWHYGFANLGRQWQNSILQITVFGFTLMILFLLLIVRNDLISAWQKELPSNAPNYFLINIGSEDVEQVKNSLHNEFQITNEQIFPMVRGRLYELNQKPILDVLSAGKRKDESLKRELNLSWSDTLPHNNKIVKGKWGKEANGISVEQGLSKRLGLKLGDVLGFKIGAQTVRAPITSIRELSWSSLQPNFYVLFPQGVLENYPHTYITSFYLPPQRSSSELYTLIQNFPNLTLISMADVLKQVQTVFNQAGSAIQYLFFFALLAGLVVLYASVYATLDQRLSENAILRALGASRYQLLSSLIAEFATLGGLSGLLAALMANGIGMALGYFLFNLELEFNFTLLAIGFFTGILIIGGVGLFATRMVIRQSPLLTLRTNT